MQLLNLKSLMLFMCVFYYANHIAVIQSAVYSAQKLVAEFYASPEDPPQPNPCRWIRASRRQSAQCRGDPGLVGALRTARHLALSHCQRQFQYERWNCTIDSKLFRKVTQEAAFVHALASAAFAYSIARACADGSMKRCDCAIKKGSVQNGRSDWHNDGCSENFHHGRRMARLFLDPFPPIRRTSTPRVKDAEDEVLRHNLDVGLRILTSKVQRVCKCHGISGSCTVQTCWRRLKNFDQVSSALRTEYYHAFRHPRSNKASRNVQRQNTKKDRSKMLQYLVTSPTYCSKTVGRVCKDESNCATLCCARGHQQSSVSVVKPCHCQMKGCCELRCQKCRVEEPLLICK